MSGSPSLFHKLSVISRGEHNSAMRAARLAGAPDSVYAASSNWRIWSDKMFPTLPEGVQCPLEEVWLPDSRSHVGAPFFPFLPTEMQCILLGSRTRACKSRACLPTGLVSQRLDHSPCSQIMNCVTGQKKPKPCIYFCPLRTATKMLLRGSDPVGAWSTSPTRCRYEIHKHTALPSWQL